MLKSLNMNFINHTFSQLTNAVRPFSTSKLKYMTTLSLHLNKKNFNHQILYRYLSRKCEDEDIKLIAKYIFNTTRIDI